MNIWSLLGISVALVATFCIIMLEVFQDKSYYEAYKWHFCGLLIGSGILFWLLGWHLLRRKKKALQAAAAQNAEGENSSSPEASSSEDQDVEEEKDSGPFLLFTPLYWGPILVTFGIIVIFIVPLSSANRVKARTGTNLVPRTNIVAALPPTNEEPKFVPIQPAKFPEVKVQGIIYRVGNPSVVIHGKACFVGDYVEEAEIVAIDRQSMTLEIRGQKKMYLLEK